jgi:predicted DNA-binding protein (MmcQ/YjbR family)
MNIEDFREYALSKPGTSEGFPFGGDTLVLKVMNKMFALTGVDAEVFKVNLKCDPDYAIELREKYPEVQAGYHMNKKMWNTVEFEGSLDEKLLRSMIDHSYDLVVKGMKKSEKEALALLTHEP